MKSILNRVAFDSRTYILLLALLLIIVASSLPGTSKQEFDRLNIDDTGVIKIELYKIPKDDVKIEL